MANKGIINYGTIGGDAKVQSNDYRIGDNTSTHATNSNVAVESILDRTSQKADALDSLGDAHRRKLQEFLSDLSGALGQLPKDNESDARAIANETDRLISAISDSGSDSTIFEQVVDGLLKAAKKVAVVAPPILAITKDIIAIAQEFSG